MKLNRSNSQSALTAFEVLVIIAIIAIIAAMLIPPALAKKRERQLRFHCMSNLKNVGLSFRMWAVDSDSRFPTEVSTNSGGTREYIETGEVFRHFRAMSNELNTPVLLVCPTDTRRAATNFLSLLSNTNVSYFIGVDAQETFPSMFLTGDRNITNGLPLPNNRIMEFTGGRVAGWTDEMHRHQGNVGLADGSVQSFSSSRLGSALMTTGATTNRLAIP